MRTFKFTIVETTQESKEFGFQFLDFDLIFQNQKFFKIPTDITEVLDNTKKVPSFLKTRFEEIFKEFSILDFANGLDFNYKHIEIFTTPFFLPTKYKYQLVKPFRTITQEFVDSLQIILTSDEAYKLESKKYICDNKELKTFLSQNIGKKYVVEEIKIDNVEEKREAGDGKLIFKSCVQSYCEQKFSILLNKYGSLELEEIFENKFEELFETSFKIGKEFSIVDNSLKDLVCFTIGEIVLYIDSKKSLSFKPSSNKLVKILDKGLELQVYNFGILLLSHCKQRLSGMLDEDFKNQF